MEKIFPSSEEFLKEHGTKDFADLYWDLEYGTEPSAEDFEEFNEYFKKMYDGLTKQLNNVIKKGKSLYRGLDIPFNDNQVDLCQRFSEMLKKEETFNWAEYTESKMGSVGKEHLSTKDQLSGVGLAWSPDVRVAKDFGECILEGKIDDTKKINLIGTVAIRITYRDTEEEEIRLNPYLEDNTIFIDRVCPPEAYNIFYKTLDDEIKDNYSVKVDNKSCFNVKKEIKY